MLHYLLYEVLYQHYGKTVPGMKLFNVFGYITFRTALASLTALTLSLVLGPWLIGRLRAFQIGQHIREEGPKSHQQKAGTPTMGGILIVLSILVPTLLWTNLRNPFIWLLMISTLAYGLIGFFDDYLKIRHRRNLGLTGRSKLLLQFSVSFLFGVVLLVLRTHHMYSTKLTVPFVKGFSPNLIIDRLMPTPAFLLAFSPFLIFVSIVIVGSSNAVNLTDGLDGLAIGCTVIASAALTALTYVTGHDKFSTYLDIQFLSGVGEVTIFCGSIVGASIGFLWYNAHPAEVFMGDVGSLALGGAIGAVAVVIKQELILIFVGGVFVIEALSVMIQVVSFKLRGKRVFLMSPLHHHFELKGWKESKVIIRFWIVALIFALFSLSTLKLR